MNKLKIKKKVDIRLTIEQLNVGESFTFKISSSLKSSQVRACVSRINKKHIQNYSTSENGLDITVTRNK